MIFKKIVIKEELRSSEKEISCELADNWRSSQKRTKAEKEEKFEAFAS